MTGTTPALGAGHEVLLPVRIDPAGVAGPTARVAAGPEWRRTSHGRYVPAYVEPTPAQRIAEVGAQLPRTAAVTGWAALAWRLARWFDGLDPGGVPVPVPVVAPTRCLRPRAALVLHEEKLPAVDREVVDGMRVTTPVRSMASVLRHAPDLDTAVTQLEMAYASDLVSPAEVAAWLRAASGPPGVVQAQAAYELAGENVWSPMEWTLRRVWGEQVPRARLLTNRPVFDLSGKHVATPDVIDPETGVTGEYDGLLTTVGPDAYRPAAFCSRLHDAYARVARRQAPERGWTLELPHWWRATHTVELRRAIEGLERARTRVAQGSWKT